MADKDEESSSDSEADEDVSDLPVVMARPAGPQQKRISVSAEVFGKYNQKDAF